MILRLRSVLDTLERDFSGERVLIVAHQVTVNCFRYLFEHLDEAQILDFDRNGDVPNCSVTSYEFDPDAGKRGDLALRLVNFVAPLEETGTPVTVAKDVRVRPESVRSHCAWTRTRYTTSTPPCCAPGRCPCRAPMATRKCAATC